MGKTVAFIDVGTNSIHMLVVRFFEGDMGTPIYQDKEAVRLGRSLYSEGRIDDETLDKAGKVLTSFASIAQGLDADEILASATCAAREDPGFARLSDVAKENGIDMRIIAGEEEARLTRLGVLGPVAPRRTLLVDIGGGSTEISIADGSEDLFRASLKLGALRMAYGTGVDQRDKVPPRKYDFLLSCVDKETASVSGTIRSIGYDTAVGSSGTLMAIASACAARRGDGNDSYFTYQELESLMKYLCRLNSRQRSKIPKIGASRADIIIGGGAVAEELMFNLGIDRMEISGNGLREGMRMDYLLKHGWVSSDVRRASVISLAGRFGADRKHGEAVSKLSLELYDRFVTAGLLQSNSSLRELMGHAAMLSEIGGVAGRRTKGELTSLIIRNSNMTGFEPDELDTLAFLAYHCRGPVPASGSKSVSKLPSALAPVILRTVMILKMADIADRGRDRSVTGFAVSRTPTSVRLSLIASGDVSLALWKMESVADEFFRVFGLDLEMDVPSN